MSTPFFPSLIVGDTTIQPIQRLPSNAFTSTPVQARAVQRAEDGTLHLTDKYTKYMITIAGLAQDTIEDIRFEYEKPETIELHSIVPRRERFNPSGTTSAFSVSRKLRTDQTVVVQSPLGTAITPALITAGNSLSNLVEFGVVDIGFTPAAGTATVFIDYYPVHIGSISDMQADYSWTDDEETWSLVFEEV
jgi:hypothetical protein